MTHAYVTAERATDGCRERIDPDDSHVICGQSRESHAVDTLQRVLGPRWHVETAAESRAAWLAAEDREYRATIARICG